LSGRAGRLGSDQRSSSPWIGAEHGDSRPARSLVDVVAPADAGTCRRYE